MILVILNAGIYHTLNKMSLNVYIQVYCNRILCVKNLNCIFIELYKYLNHIKKTKIQIFLFCMNIEDFFQSISGVMYIYTQKLDQKDFKKKTIKYKINITRLLKSSYRVKKCA